MGKWTRRGLIAAGAVAGGALIVGVALRPGQRARELAPLVAGDNETLINVWVKIDHNSQVTAIVPHAEMGQGAQTALAQMLADELDADWANVGFMEAPAVEGYANYALGKGYILGNIEVPAALLPTVDGAFLKITQAMNLQITGGSTSVRATGVHGMRVAGAAAREMLMTAAADAWQVPFSELTTQRGEVVHAPSGKRGAYGQLAAAAGELTPPAKPALKAPEQFTIMGKSVARHDIPAKVDGSAKFGIDADLPGMKIATIQAAPVFGATLASVDDTRALAMPGVVKVVQLPDAVAVIADGYWQAKQALAAVTISWAESEHDAATSESLFAQFDADMQQAVEQGNESVDLKSGDAQGAIVRAEVGDADGARVIRAAYRVPYLAHACMEPMNATVAINGNSCEVWVGSQNPLGTRASVAAALELEPSQVTVHNQLMGGGFGRRATDDAVVQAALLARAAGTPVKLIWSREEDMRHDHYRPAVTSRFSAVLDNANQPIAWENQFVDKHEPAEAPYIPYDIEHQYIHYTTSPTHVPFGPWRSVDHSQHGFFTEAFVDEVAAAAGKDPFEFRRNLLSGKPRHKAVLELAAQKANWSTPVAAGHGRGIALQESFGTIVAQVVDVAVRQGKVRVERVVCVVDPGFAISPDGLTAQMESGILYGLTAALYGNVQLAGGAVVQSNFHDYPIVRMDEAPDIQTHIINSGAPIGGGGEPGTPAIAPALVNAVFAATGTRVRELPLGKYDLNYRITEPDEVIIPG